MVTNLECQSETRLVSEDERGKKKVVPVWTTESRNVICMVIQNSVSLLNFPSVGSPKHKVLEVELLKGFVQLKVLSMYPFSEAIQVR